MAIIFDIKRFAIHDGPGIRTTVFLKGCWLSCQWCHNPESMDGDILEFQKKVRINNQIIYCNETVGKEISLNQLMNQIGKEIPFMKESGGGVTFSGGEPFFQFDFLLEALKACKALEIHTAIDTSGFVSWDKLSQTIPYTDLYLFDMKLMDDEKHKEFTGVSNKIILQNLEKLINGGQNVRVRIPMVKDISFEKNNIDSTIEYLLRLKKKPLSIDLLPYHNTGKLKYENFNIPNNFLSMQTLKTEELENIQHKLQELGFSSTVGG